MSARHTTPDSAVATKASGIRYRMSRARARAVLRGDMAIRVMSRAARLLFYGLVAAVYVWVASAVVLMVDWIRAVGAGPADDLPPLPRTGDVFSATVDPVLPTLAAALLALAVIKATGFATGYIAGASTVVGSVAVMWMLFSVTALIGGPLPDDAAANAVAAVAMAGVCVVVTIAITEVLPLSAKARRRQLRRRADVRRDAAVRLRERTAERPVLPESATPFAPRSTRLGLAIWYIVFVLVTPIGMLPYALSSTSSEAVASLVLAALIGLLLGVVVAACQSVIVGWYQSPPTTLRATLAVDGVALALWVALIVAASVGMMSLGIWRIRIAAVIPLVLVAVALAATFAPLIWRMPRLWLLAQLAVAHRAFVLQRSSWRDDERLIAMKRLERRKGEHRSHGHDGDRASRASLDDPTQARPGTRALSGGSRGDME